MKIAIVTAGGAGMFCGSCMQDNTLARSLHMAGADALLLPTYTPIRVDEENVSSSHVFLGGINVYLDSKLPGWRLLPRITKRWLDRPGIVKWLSKLSSSTNAADLGPLTIDLLNGSHGPQRQEIEELVKYLVNDLQPDIILFSNALLSGIVPDLRRRFSGKLVCLLQGDDIFLQELPEPWKSRALSLVSQNAAHFDAFLTHSTYYADFMKQYLSLPGERFHTIPLTIERPPEAEFATRKTADETGVTVGYFARICPEKGAMRFLEAAERVLPMRPDMKMVMGGFLPEQHRVRFEKSLRAVQESTGNRLTWAGSPAHRDEKFQLLSSFDWLCVPSEYREPKGLYVLEAAIAGVPSLVPAHGAFPERISTLGAGILFQPGSNDSLEKALRNLQPERSNEDRLQLRQHCLSHHGMQETGRKVLEVLRGI